MKTNCLSSRTRCSPETTLDPLTLDPLTLDPLTWRLPWTLTLEVILDPNPGGYPASYPGPLSWSLTLDVTLDPNPGDSPGL